MARISAAAIQRALGEVRRASRRYDVALPLRFSALRRGQAALTGTGESVNISCTGMLFRCTERLVAGDSLIAVVDWPVAAPDNEPLKLVVTGNVARVRRGMAAIVIHSHRLLREGELDRRLSVFWAPVVKGGQPAQRAPQAAPVVLIEDDDTVALLVSLVVTPQNWTVERADVEAAKEILASGEPAIALLVTRTPELLDALPPEIPGILTLEDNAPEDAAAGIAAQPRRVVLRRPLADAGIRSLIEMLCPPAEAGQKKGTSAQWTQ